jgi:hypothetical protein
MRRFEFDGGLLPEAAAPSLDCCVAQWLNRSPIASGSLYMVRWA